MLEYRPLGKTGLTVSPLCFGTLTVGPVQANLPLEQGAEILAYGITKGINFFDTAQLYETYPYLKRAMELANNEEIIISSKTYAYTKEMAHQAVEEARQQTGRDVIDIFMLHEQESIHTLRGHLPALEVLYDYKAKGIIKGVGASMHHIAAVRGAIQLGLDVIHPLLNIEGLGIVDGTRQEMEEALKEAHQHGIGIFSMKPIGGGNLFHSAGDCLQYALSQTYVDCVAVGMQSTDEVDANLHFLKTGSFSQEDQRRLDGKVRRLHIDDWCSGCGTCVTRCSQQALQVEMDRAVCNPERCILCGYCSTVCPMWAIKVV